ncbi:MAG: bacillithiol system protein YtxJ [Chlamydiales bacterium]|jgi:bacillithiol system protein YtxJ
MHETLELPEDPAAALEVLRAASSKTPVLVFKRSPICPVSHRAEAQVRKYLDGLTESDRLLVVDIDVIDERALARGLTAELGIAHESPQALWFKDAELAWHGSHGALTATRFAELARGEFQ